MVFEVVPTNGDVMPPFIFLLGLRINTEAYIKCLEEVELRWIKYVAAERSYIYYQDSGPSPPAGESRQ